MAITNGSFVISSPYTAYNNFVGIDATRKIIWFYNDSSDAILWLYEGDGSSNPDIAYGGVGVCLNPNGDTWYSNSTSSFSVVATRNTYGTAPINITWSTV